MSDTNQPELSHGKTLCVCLCHLRGTGLLDVPVPRTQHGPWWKREQAEFAE